MGFFANLASHYRLGFVHEAPNNEMFVSIIRNFVLIFADSRILSESKNCY
jgi:hypothetical protein